jgi:hypothetical protein
MVILKLFILRITALGLPLICSRKHLLHNDKLGRAPHFGIQAS